MIPLSKMHSMNCPVGETVKFSCPIFKISKLSRLIVCSSVPVKAVLQIVHDSMEDNRVTYFLRHGTSWDFIPPSLDMFIVTPEGEGFNGFRVLATNLDTEFQATIYVTFMWFEESIPQQ